MKFFNISVLALITVTSLCLASCNKDDKKEPKEIILLSSAKIELGYTGGSINVGMRFNYDENNNITEGYDYFLQNKATTQQIDTNNYYKYTFDRSTAGVVFVKIYNYNEAGKKWESTNEEKKLIYNGSNLSRIETYNNGILNSTDKFTWSGDKAVERHSGLYSVVIDSAKYANDNYVDYPASTQEYTYASLFIRSTYSAESTFGGKSNFLNIVPFEFAMVMRHSQAMFPLGQYFSKNALSQTVKTYQNEEFEADKTTLHNIRTTKMTTDYVYTYGSISTIYPITIKQIIKSDYSYIDHLNSSNDDCSENRSETIITLSLTKK